MRKSWGISPWKVVLFGLAALWGFGVLTGTFLASRTTTMPTPQAAPLLKEIQQLGQLHTVRYNIHDVFEHERSLQPEGWVRSIPGADRLYASTTKNSVLLTAEGGVEAGVDLSQISNTSVSRVITPEGTTRLRVRLPRATVFAPEVHLKVMEQRSGIFWNDDNIVPEASEQASQRFRDAAYKSGILAAAETNAIKRLSDMQQIAGNTNVEFYF